MHKSKLLIAAFIIVAAVQWYVPGSMILDRENVLAAGKEYKFKTAPVDPNDPFRGKYITLNFAANTVKIKEKENWTTDETIYVLIANDTGGYVKIEDVSKVKPAGSRAFVKAKVDFTPYDSTLTIAYPFERYYMEESKASGAESAYRESSRDTGSTTFALVKIKDGEAVLKDVFIDNMSIKEIVKARNNK